MKKKEKKKKLKTERERTVVNTLCLHLPIMFWKKTNEKKIYSTTKSCPL